MSTGAPTRTIGAKSAGGVQSVSGRGMGVAVAVRSGRPIQPGHHLGQTRQAGRPAVPDRPVTVQHIPASHPYVTSIGASLPDPPVPGAPPGQWWPHPALTPDWVRSQRESTADRAALVHLHFGFEHRTPAQLREWVDALDTAGIPLVLTVHDLVNPHLPPPPDAPGSPYDELLDVLVPAAAAVTTLTTGAARVIERRWHRTALVHPHPPLVADDWLDRPRRRARTALTGATGTTGASPHEGGEPWVVTVHLKSLRANVDLGAVARLREALRAIPGAQLRLHVHTDVLEPDHPRHDPRLAALARAGGAEPTLDLRIHGPLDDEALWADLLDADLAVLPYRFGTHSGWLELCHDLGTPVLAPAIGHLADQRPIRTWRPDDPGDLAATLTAAHQDFRAGRTPRRPGGAARRAERDAVRRLHQELYTRLIAQSTVESAR